MFDFIMKQILGMQWLNEAVWGLLKDWFNAAQILLCGVVCIFSFMTQ